MVQILLQIRCQRLTTHITRQTDIIQISVGPSAGNEGLTWARHAVNCFSADFTSRYVAYSILPTVPRPSGGQDDFCQLYLQVLNSSKYTEIIEHRESDFSSICFVLQSTKKLQSSVQNVGACPLSLCSAVWTRIHYPIKTNLI